jgi:uncharacterized Fe-S cluster protein YjdI
MIDRKIVKKYSKDDITVVWQPHICEHSGICARELGSVFNPHRRPWIDMDAATAERIVEQVERCPSGALTWRKTDSPDE